MVQQRSMQIPERAENTGNRNWFEGLSHDWKASFTMGKLVPFLSLLAFPNDYFKIRTEAMLRFAPLYLPIFHRVNIAMDYFYVPMRIIWNQSDTQSWNYFIMGKDDASLLVPFVNYTAFDYVGGSGMELPMYMGVPTIIEEELPQTLTIPISALKLVGYYMTYDQYYRNDQIQAAIKAENQLTDGTAATVFTNEPATSLQCAYRNWNRDLFTSCTPEPQAGGPVQIPLVGDFNDDAIPDYPTLWRKLSDGTPSGTGDVVTETDGTTKIAVSNVPIGLDIGAVAATIESFRFAVVYQEFLERQNRTGDKISDYYPNFWSTDPFKGTLQLPQFLGTKKGRIVISEVMSTAETETLKVGNYAGQALGLESTRDTIEYHCLEHGVVLGIISVYPDSGYFQGLARDWSYRTYLDFPDPRFALIGDEEVLNKEVQYAFQDALLARNNQVFGYRERDATSRFQNDVVAGLLRTTLNSFHLGRLLNPLDPESLTNGSVLNSEFLQCKPRVTDVFQVTSGEDEIYCHIYNDIKVQRMLPKFGIPNL